MSHDGVITFIIILFFVVPALNWWVGALFWYARGILRFVRKRRRPK